MCGIGGVVGLGRVRLADTAHGALRHRGPDGSGRDVQVGDGWSWDLIHSRLSIIDLSDAGNQPMSTLDGRLTLVFNGEIYNSPLLRAELLARGHRFQSSMDGEVILHLWEEIGAAALGRLNGIFSLAVGDRLEGTLTVARDPVGVKPLFFVEDGATLWFASELRSLAAGGADLGGRDVVGLAQFLTFLWIPDPGTPFENARSLLPGHLVEWRAGSTNMRRYTDALVPTPHAGPPGRELVAEASRQVGEATRRQLLADVPVGLMASGGVDSSLLWWAAADVIPTAYTIAWHDTGSEGLEEDTLAVRSLGARFGTTVVELEGRDAPSAAAPVSSLDLFADPAFELTELIASNASADGYKVLLSGQGGDELFGGYRRHFVASLIGRLHVSGASAWLERRLRGRAGSLRAEYVARLARAVSEQDPFRGYMQLCTYSTAVDRARILGCNEAEVTDDVVWARHQEVFDSLPSGLSFFRRATSLDLLVYLPGLGLGYADRAAMLHGVEVRVPLLDLELVRWALTLPDSALIRRGRGKWIMRALAERAIGAELAHRPKRPFGAPSNALTTADAPSYERGFRQSRYLDRARRVLEVSLAGDARRQ